MENVIFIHKGHLLYKSIVGGLLIGVAIILLVLGIGSLELKDWFTSIMLLILGLLYFTSLFGYHKSAIIYGEDNMRIRWRGRFGEITIPYAEIGKLTYASNAILINRKGKKVVILTLAFLKEEERKVVLESLIEFSRQRNLDLEK